MWKRWGKDKKKAPSPNTRESLQAISPPPSILPAQTTIAEDGRRASEPSTSTAPRPTRLGRLTSSPTTLGPSSNYDIPDRSRSRSVGRHEDPLGLIVVHEPETSPPLDIIFVHGLGGTSRATWAKGRDPQYFWPKQWLPFEPGIRTARILSFGYNANFAATGPAPITGIADFAKDLLYSMKFAKDEHLEELELGQRPIIFIVHSMGGLVVKQAYILGQNDEKYSGIVSSINAILFLATPHRGSNLAHVLNRILTASVFSHSPKLYVSELRDGSQTIEALNDQFRHIAPRLNILSFYETLQTPVGPKKMMVVDKSSATLGYADEISRSLNADHHTVCKFDSVQDSNYISIRNALKTLVASIRSTGQHMLGGQGKTQLEQLETLLAVSENHQDDLEFFRKRWTPGTCDWILFNAPFKKWVDESEESPTMLWLHALPASGKSILSSFLINHLLEESFCVYYFFRFGDQSKRSLSTCLRTIAFQTAEQLPQFRRALQDIRFSTKTAEKTDAKTIWEKVFIGVLFKMRIKTTMFWIIDALDESDHPQLLVELMQSIPDSSAPIKVLLVSRQTPELISTFDRLSMIVPCVYLPLEDTKKDIRVCVEKEVQYMHAAPEFKLQIVEKLVAGAVGNFLWASLALVEVMRCNTQEDLDKTLEGIPSGMEQMYQRMERKIIEKTRSRDHKLGQMILTWATCSRRPLVLKELAQALEPEFSVMLDLTFTISRVCGQFVVIDSTDQLVMVHQTARDHIIATDSALAVNVTEGHRKLFMKCLSVLEEKHQRRDLDRRPSNQEFVNYAMTSWAYHLNMISPESNAPLQLLSKFLKGNSVLAWIVSLAQQNQLKLLVYASKSMNLYVRRKRRCQAATNPLLHPLQELDLVESWATDFLKLLGKFGRNLTANPTSIYQQIPPFCPKNSMIYRQFEKYTSLPHGLSVEGISKTVWDDSLAKISLGPQSQALVIVCSGDHFAILTAAGLIVLYSSTTFETKQMLTHAERVCAMSFSSSSNLLVTYAFRTTKVWSVSTGQIMYQIRNPRGSRAFTIQFSARDTELVIGSNDGLIRFARLTVSDPIWSIVNQRLLKDDTALDRPVHNVPWRIAFNSDASCVAVAYRGSPLCVWAMDPPELIGRCMRNQEYVGNSWTVVDQIIWHPKSDEILGLYMGGHVFRWNPYADTQQELQAEASILASSPEGKFFVTGDSNGTIKLYNFHHFALIYQLSCENMINDICFSPDSKRLYDLRGQFCNIWEPNALLRVEETSEDSEDGSDVASNPTAAVSEAFVEVRDQITAIAIQFRGRYQAIGNEAGVVSVVDSLEGDPVAIQLWRSPVMLPIGHLDWSSDGFYLACAELTGKVVVKRVQLEDGLSWTVRPGFDVKLKVSSEGIRQVLLNNDGRFLLVKNGPSVTVWPMSLPSSSDSHNKSITSPDTKWIKHPTDSNLLLVFSPSLVRVYLWDDLIEIAVFNLDGPPLFSSPDANQTSGEIDKPARTAKISSIFTNPPGSHFLMDTVLATNEGQAHFTSVFETSIITPSSATLPRSTVTPTPVPPEIQHQIEIPLGILPKQRLIFLDKDYWMCSWRLGANLTTEKVQRYYFLPKDWLNVECLGLSALLADGRFLIPNNGELAVIKSTGVSHW
ncbi:MAG: hypothetical protein ASARMPREDX12_005007 [Alectoria sarmentosa]|nr:MAG: hypothetical protein ASARMPRED_003620 [Alectoria sarmentosa]CAD6572212.1 MAG: hypothetical protein ASARMPREDX12_005007 [Alectoria sarmentosa]